jgi:transposase
MYRSIYILCIHILHKKSNYSVLKIEAITMDHVQGFDRNQEILFPAKIDDYIEEENLVRFIEAFVALLDLPLLGFAHAEVKTTGRPSYNPADLLKLYIYGYLNTIRSSRKLEKETHRNVEVMWLLKKLTPDHKTIADFRKNNAGPIKKVFKEFVLFCKEPDLYGRETVGIDGSKFKAVNSKKRNFNKDKLIKKLKDRKSEYKELLKKLEETGEKQVSTTDPDSRMMMNNQKFDVCYNVQTTIDDKNNLIVDYEVTNDVNDKKQLNEMAGKAKEILGVESLDVFTDKGYYNPDEIKKCVDNNTIPYIPEPKPKQPKEDSVPKAGFCDCDFKYDASKDVYACPEGRELTFSVMSEKNNKMMKEYRSDSCSSCESK